LSREILVYMCDALTHILGLALGSVDLS